jgi:hypothetical protein
MPVSSSAYDEGLPTRVDALAEHGPDPETPMVEHAVTWHGSPPSVEPIRNLTLVKPR